MFSIHFGSHFMITMDGEDGQRQLRQMLLLIPVAEAAIKVHAGVAQDDHRVVLRRLYAFAESVNPAEFSVGVSCDVEHRCSPRFSYALSQATASFGHSMNQYR